MATKIIPEELDILIQEYLTDRFISPEERRVLLNKAVKLGLDVNEIDLYINAQQQKVRQRHDLEVNQRRGQVCPYCGGSVPLMSDKCPHCEQNITPQATTELNEIIDKLEDALVSLKSDSKYERSRAEVNRYARKAKLYYSNNPKIKVLLEEVERETSQVDREVQKQNRRKAHEKNAPFVGGIAVAIAAVIGIIALNISMGDGTIASIFVELILAPVFIAIYYITKAIYSRL